MGGVENTTAGSGGAWDSALPVGDFAAIRSVGFEPVGQVFGAAVYYLSSVLGAGCPGTSADSLLRDATPSTARASGRRPAAVHGIAGPAAKVAQGLYEGRRTAIDRMTDHRHLEQAVRSVGADGVVVSAMTLRVRSDACRAHPGGTDHFAEAVTAGTSVARFASPRKGAPPGLAVVHLDAGHAGQR